MADIIITQDYDAPIRRPADATIPWSTISDIGTAYVGGKELLFTAARTFDKREPRGQRVTYDVELRRRWGKGFRAVDAEAYPEVTKAILNQLKDRIEADNAKVDRTAAQRVERAAEDAPSGDELAGLKVERTITKGRSGSRTFTHELSGTSLAIIAINNETSQGEVFRRLKAGETLQSAAGSYKLVQPQKPTAPVEPTIAPPQRLAGPLPGEPQQRRVAQGTR